MQIDWRGILSRVIGPVAKGLRQLWYPVIAVLLFLGFLLMLPVSPRLEDDLAAKYAERVRQLGMTPVYPPREDFQVGDILLISSSADNRDETVQLFVGHSKTIYGDSLDFSKTGGLLRGRSRSLRSVPGPVGKVGRAWPGHSRLTTITPFRSSPIPPLP